MIFFTGKARGKRAIVGAILGSLAFLLLLGLLALFWTWRSMKLKKPQRGKCYEVHHFREVNTLWFLSFFFNVILRMRSKSMSLTRQKNFLISGTCFFPRVQKKLLPFSHLDGNEVIM